MVTYLQGNRRLTDAEISRFIKSKSGDLYSVIQLQEDFQSLLKSGLFDAINTRIIAEEGRRGGTIIIFEVFESPLLAELNFEGLGNIQSEEILKELRTQNSEIGVGLPFRPEKMNRARQIIEKHLRSRGFEDITITFSMEEISATALKNNFNIESKSGLKFIKI